MNRAERAQESVPLKSCEEVDQGELKPAAAKRSLVIQTDDNRNGENVNRPDEVRESSKSMQYSSKGKNKEGRPINEARDLSVDNVARLSSHDGNSGIESRSAVSSSNEESVDSNSDAWLPSSDDEEDSVSSSSSLRGASQILPPSVLEAPSRAFRPMLFQQDLLGLIDQSLLHQQHAAVHNNPVLGLMSAERMARMMQQNLYQVEIQNLIRGGKLASTSNHTDTAMLEHIENSLHHDNEFGDAVKEVNASLTLENVTGADLVETTEEYDLTREIAAAMSALDISHSWPSPISEEELEIEQASMTNVEKADALSDLYGKFSAMNIHQDKKQKRSLDRRSIDFLIRQMKVEIDAIPNEKKQALLQAQVKCRSEEEFCDSRFEKFLKSEGMNTKHAAQCFVNYWESRRELFGESKFHLRMTLSEALRDDVTAIEAGVWTILPYPDKCGRMLCLIHPTGNTRKGYSPESLVRAIWYISEVLARESTDPDCPPPVFIHWHKNVALGHYDSFYVRKTPYYQSSCWPLKKSPNHGCCPSWFYRKIGKPIILSTLDKGRRARTMIHDVPDSEILGTLAEYGITKDMLPTFMGGDVDMDTWMPLFIAQRRAAEMEEI